MAGLNHLSQIVEKIGIDRFQLELSKPIRVFEKIDGNSFGFEKNANDQLIFYKRDASTPISIIDRTLMQKYEKVIAHIESRKKFVFPGVRYYVEIIADQPNIINYSKIPRNNLILKGAHYGSNKIVKTETLNQIAQSLRIEASPLVFEGVLEQYTIDAIIDFIQKTPEEQKTFLHSYNFTEYFYTLLNPNLSSSSLHHQLSEAIEGLVFEFQNGIIGKLVNSSIDFYVKGTPKSMYHLALSDMLSFMQKQNYFEFQDDDESKSVDQFYLNFCTYFFLKYYHLRKDNLLHIPRPDFMSSSDFDLNLKFNQSREFSTLIGRSEQAETIIELFKIFLNGFRKKKKRAVGLFNDEKINDFNYEVERIQKYIAKGNQIIGFSDFSKLTQ